MTWIDFVLIGFILVSIGMGARMGSLWIGACLAAGFFGAFLVDVYALPLSAMFGRFPGAVSMAMVLLFTAGCIAFLAPGWILSRISEGLFLGVVDSAFGLIVGSVAGLCAVTLVLLLLVPLFPKIEKAKAWKNSILVRPLQNHLEDTLSAPHFRRSSKLMPAAQETGEDLKDAATKILHEIKKN